MTFKKGDIVRVRQNGKSLVGFRRLRFTVSRVGVMVLVECDNHFFSFHESRLAKVDQ